MSWERYRLTEVCDFQGGTQPPKSEWSSEHKDGFIRMLQIRDFTQGKENFIEYVKDNKSLKKCTENDILIGRYGASIGKILTGLRGAYNVAMIKTVPSKSLVNRFLYYYLLTKEFQNYISQIGSRAAQAGFNKDDLKELYIPVPNISIQTNIAEILDKADTLRKKDKQLLQYYDDLAQSLFIDMFGDPVRNEKVWPQKSLGSVCIKITDGTHFSPPSMASGVPYITAKHVRKNKVDFFNNPTYVSQEDHEAIYSRCTPVKGDVLYIKDGATTGNAAINNYDFEFSMLSSLALIKVNKQLLNNYFLAHWLNNENIKENYIRNYMAGAAIRRFTLDKIKRFEILIPPIDLQNQFAEQIQNIEQQKEKLKLQIQESENLFQALLQKAFNGGLN